MSAQRELRSSLRAALGSRTRATITIPGFAEAAVLVPLLRRLDAVTLAMLRRPEEMPTHAGQIAFPGGRRDSTDTDLIACALREADEELGIAPVSVDVLGSLDDVPTPLGFVITPVVGWIEAPAPLAPSAREVAECFEIPLATLRDPAVYAEAGDREFRGVRYRMIEYRVDGRVIWGATARMIQQLLAMAFPA